MRGSLRHCGGSGLRGLGQRAVRYQGIVTSSSFAARRQQDGSRAWSLNRGEGCMKGITLALAVAGALMLAGCGGSKSVSMTPTPTPTRTLGPGAIPLPTGHTLVSGTIPTGETRTVREADGMRTTVRCSTGSENCIITVADDGTVTLIAGSLRIEIEGITVVTPTTPPPAPFPRVNTTWEQLPSLVDSMADYGIWSASYPFPTLASNIKLALKVILDAATEPTGTMRRFQGTRTVQLDGGDSVTGSFWGGWLDNSIFLVENIPGRNFVNSRGDVLTRWRRQIAAGIESTPATWRSGRGVYRGEAVDVNGNWGTSEVTYTRSAAYTGFLDLTIDIPAHRHRGTMSWENIPVDIDGPFDHTIPEVPGLIPGPNRVRGQFYQGGEVEGVFTYRWSHVTGDNVKGAFGAKLIPASP